MPVDLDHAETLQTGAEPERVDGAGTPLPAGARFNTRGHPISEGGKIIPGLKQRKDLMQPGTEGGWTARKRGRPKKGDVVAEAPASAPTPEPEKPPKLTRSRAETKLAMRWGQMWDLMAEGWADDSLRVTPEEEKEWAEPVAYVMEQMGWLHHTDKLDWIGAAAVTGKQAGPRVTRMLNNHPRPFQVHPDGPSAAPPVFRRPAGMGRRGAPVGEPMRAESVPSPVAVVPPPSMQAEGADNPLPLDPMFLPREDGYGL